MGYLVMAIIFGIPAAVLASFIALAIRCGNWLLNAAGVSAVLGLVIGIYFNENLKATREVDAPGILIIFTTIPVLYILFGGLLFKGLFTKKPGRRR